MNACLYDCELISELKIIMINNLSNNIHVNNIMHLATGKQTLLKRVDSDKLLEKQSYHGCYQFGLESMIKPTYLNLREITTSF